MAYKVVKLNYEEIQLWNSGSYLKCGHIRKVSFEIVEEVEIRNSENERLAYATVTAVEKYQSRFDQLKEGVYDKASQLAFEANLPPAPTITLLTFKLKEDWEVQE